MPRTRPLVRQWNLLHVLSQHSKGLSIHEMARETNVNPRTIHRDLRLFVEAGVPLRETVSLRNKKYWYVERQEVGFLGRASSEECLALLLAHFLLRPMADTEMYQALSSCRDKALASMPPDAEKQARDKIAALIQSYACVNGGSLDLSQLDALWDWLIGIPGSNLNPA